MIMEAGEEMMKKRMILFLLFCVLFLVHEIDASPLVMVEVKNDVEGYVGESIEAQIVELSLNDEEYRFEVDDYDDVTEWFDNIPSGLEAYVLSHEDQSIRVCFEGTPLEESSEMISVNVPDGSIIDEVSEDSIGDLCNIPSEDAMYRIVIRQPLAYYDREGIVKGTVGKKLEKQRIYVRLENTVCEASMMGHAFPEHNGLTGTVVGILPENVIVIEYEGTPLKKDKSLIHTVLSDEDLRCDMDLIVPDREDVRFRIGEEKKEEEVKESVIPVIPHTGID